MGIYQIITKICQYFVPIDTLITGDLDTDVLMDYLKLKNPVTQLTEERIKITQSSTSSVTSQGSIFKISYGFVLIPIFIDTILLLYQLT